MFVLGLPVAIVILTLKTSFFLADAILSAALAVPNLPILSAELDSFSATSSERKSNRRYVWAGVAFSLGVILYDLFLGVAGIFAGFLPFNWVGAAVGLLVANVFVMMAVDILARREVHAAIPDSGKKKGRRQKVMFPALLIQVAAMFVTAYFVATTFSPYAMVVLVILVFLFPLVNAMLGGRPRDRASMVHGNHGK